MTIADGDPAVAEDVLAAIAAAGTPIVTNIAALRGLATAPATKSIFVSGYYAAGDGGGGIFAYNSADTSTADNGGTICVDTLGHRYYRQHGSAPLNAAWFGAVGDGTTVNDAAFNNMMTVAMAQTGGAQVLFPPGKFRFSSQLTITYPSGRPYNLELKGSGAILYWPASGGGMVFAYSEPSHILLLEGMTFTVGVANGGAGITITQSDPLLNFVNTNVRAVTFRGDDDINTGGSFYWSNGAIVNNVSGTNWEGCTFYGGNVSAGVYGGNGINFSGTGVGGPSGINYSIYHNIAKGIFNGLNVGIAYGSYAQGITIGQCNFQNTMTGFDAQASETGQLSQLQIFDSQFACNLNCISVLTSIGNCFIEHNDIFVTQGTTGILLIDPALIILNER